MIRVANWSDASVVKVEFNVWAKNGEQVGTVRHVDGTTFEFIMKDLAGLPNYGEKITLNANTGNKIHEIFFPGTGDWYTIDNLTITTNMVNPAAVATAQQAQAVVVAETQTLTTLQTVQTAAATDLSTKQTTLTTEKIRFSYIF